MSLKEVGLGEEVHPEVKKWCEELDCEELKIWIEDVFRNDTEYLRYGENRSFRNAGYMAQEIINEHKNEIDKAPDRLKNFIYEYADHYKTK